MPTDDYEYETDKDDYSNHTLYCPNPGCERICWGVYVHTEYDTNASCISPESDENCPDCGTEGLDDNPNKEIKS